MRLQALRTFALLALVVPCLTACPPQTQMGGVSATELRAEQVRQQALAITAAKRETQRLLDVAWPLLKAARPICGPRGLATRTGILVTNLPAFSNEFRDGARSLGFSDTLTVTGVAPGSAGDRAGVKVGDNIVAMASGPLPKGANAVYEFVRRTERPADERRAFALDTSAIALLVRRTDSTGAARTLDVSIAPDTACAYFLSVASSEELNAWADGRFVTVTSAMLRFTQTDDELAVVLSHEIAHDALRHIDRKKKNAVLGGLLGAALDVAAATAGVNTGGGFSSSGASVGAGSHSQDFEREADYVGMYILALAGRPYAQAPNFWRRMGQESPGSISYASSHPTSAERYIRLERTAAEIKGKVDAGKPLLPEATVPGTPADPTSGR